MQTKDVQAMVKNLEMYRTEHKMSQVDFAKRIGMSKSAYSKLLAGDTANITVDTLKNIYDTTGKLCYQLMDIESDDYLTLCNLIRTLNHDEIKYMIQFVEVYLEAKRRI